ncbi:MAG TPA: transketolase [Atribacterota bacterium]|nr:transketolase [Atribacterota bacterium]
MITEVAKIIRGLSVDAIEKANSGHPGLPLGCADIGAVLFGEVLKYDPEKPDWLNRDRFVLSAGHGSIMLYVLLHLSGYAITLEDIKNFRQVGSITPGHPEYGLTPGVEATTGPLGQGFANGVGMALAERMLAQKYNKEDFDIINHYTYVLASDGCMMEGITSEAASLAGHWGLEKLVVVYDKNQVSLSGSTELTFTESVADRFRAYNWQVIDKVNGHDIDEIRTALMKAKEKNGKPVLIIAETHIGYGAPTKQDSYTSHGAPLGSEEVTGLKKKLGLPLDKTFYISDTVREYFQVKKSNLLKERQQWEEKYSRWSEKYPEERAQLQKALNLEIPEKMDFWALDIDEKIATRSASGEILNNAAEEVPYLVGGSADLDPSTMTYLSKFSEIQKGCYNGRNIRFGVREHAMGAICSGLSLHKGLRPFCSTFLVFSDYMRPALRLAALMRLPVIFIFTHDSVYVGEDGPTHQPIEQLESLRIIPGLQVIRPADSDEVKAAWQHILGKKEGPVALILSRQKLSLLKKSLGIKEFSRGGYIIYEGDQNPQVIISASGSEVQTALQVKDILERDSITCRIISIPDRETFASQDWQYREYVLNNKQSLQVAIEAATGQGWYEVIPGLSLGIFIRQFAESGPGEEVAAQFGFEPEKIANTIKARYKTKKD